MERESNRLRQLIMGFRVTQLLYTAAKFDLAGHLAKKALTAPELAAAISRHPLNGALLEKSLLPKPLPIRAPARSAVVS